MGELAVAMQLTARLMDALQYQPAVEWAPV